MKKIIVSGLQSKIRLDIYLTNKLQQKRSYIDKLLDNKLILVDQQLPIKKGQLIDNGNVIGINEKSSENSRLEFSNKEIPIVFEDKYIIVVNKPKNLIVHPTSFNEQNTLVNILINKIKVDEFDDQLRPGVVHRLDRDTSGLIVLAKNKIAYDKLVNQIKNKSLTRNYLALVHNNFMDTNLLIKAPIDRSKQNVLKMVVSDDPKAKFAVTEVKVLENYSQGALIECNLLTGRTHQIRVHLSYIHHPVYNDDLYGSYDGYKGYGQFLHARYLRLEHPITNELMEFTVEPDNIFQTLRKKLREDK
jgi:23S rRNA pseudouridine1911/1915/1917 synthase